MKRIPGAPDNFRRRDFFRETGALAAAVAIPLHIKEAGTASGAAAIRPGQAMPTPHALSGGISLSDFGGVPGAGGDAIISAFHQAFDLLKRAGGGVLFIPPGIYDLGEHGGGIYLIRASDLQNVEISGYGATLQMTTTAVTTNVFFNLENPSNVSVRGLSFYDHGTDLSVDWRGAVCFDVYTTRPCSGFRTVDCTADHVLNFFRSFAQGEEKYTLTGCDLNAVVKNSYYGINMKYNGRYSKCNLTCIAVRRGFIGYGVKNWHITMHCNSRDRAKGSNGFINLITFTEDPAEHSAIKLTVTGSTNPYTALVHFYHQDVGEQQTIRDISASVDLKQATGRATIFLFDHALKTGVKRETTRTFERITLDGTVGRRYAGKVIANPSVSTGLTNDIKVSRHLVRDRDMAALPKYIVTFMPC